MSAPRPGDERRVPLPSYEGEWSALKAVKDKRVQKLLAEASVEVRKSPQPTWLEPMLATLAHRHFSRAGWLFEPKYDGIRCLAFREGANVCLYSRNHHSANSANPEVVRSLEEQGPASFIMDGEIVAFDGDRTSFEKLQQRMQVRQPSASLQSQVPVCFCVFDLPCLEGFDLRRVPLRLR